MGGSVWPLPPPLFNLHIGRRTGSTLKLLEKILKQPILSNYKLKNCLFIKGNFDFLALKFCGDNLIPSLLLTEL